MKSNTKNAKGSGTIRKRSDGRWEARYTTGIDPKTGKQIQKSVYGKTQKEVRQKLMEVTAEIDSGTYLEQTKDTVGEWLDTWLKTTLNRNPKEESPNCKNYPASSRNTIPITVWIMPKYRKPLQPFI